jgi:hypothetical protein
MVLLQAPLDVRGQVETEFGNYPIAPNGSVTVDSRVVSTLLDAGFIVGTVSFPLTQGINDLRDVTTPAVILQNTSAADAVNTEQRSPAVEFQGSYYASAAEHAMEATLDLEFQADGGGLGPMLVLRVAGVAVLGFANNLPGTSGQFVWPDASGVFDGNIDCFRGDYGFGTDTLNYENYAAAGGYVLAASAGGVVVGSSTDNGALLPLNGTETLGSAAHPWVTLNTKALTVATLPAAATAGVGARAFVTDALTTLALGIGTVVANGGSNKVPVYSDGTNWLYG